MAENTPVLEGTIVTMAKLSAEDKIRQQCEREEKFERDRISAINYGRKIGLAEGKAEGLSEGRAKGKAEGLAEGHAKGKAEGLSEGHAKGKAEAKKDLQKLLSLMSETDDASLILEMAKDPSLLDKMFKKYNLD